MKKRFIFLLLLFVLLASACNNIDELSGQTFNVAYTPVLHFENDNENLEIKFTVKESDKDFSEYSAIISDVDFVITDTDKISHFKNLSLTLTKDMSIEFLKEKSL
ncbi:hypothetical protein QGM71_20150 [Virgibacillus sp. C22-A2]|uniref:Uncharacterized protein n=1 Tax=Virgibacillus tibetensis TaxID=3042313 RepID=A0ABU6KKQ8_9BACI|nr:hypothetical protein [Virgibacillus sp. C22-A2]